MTKWASIKNAQWRKSLRLSPRRACSVAALLAVLCGIPFAVVSCIGAAAAPTKTPEDVRTFGEDQIKLTFKASAQLNLEAGLAHTMVIFVAQMKDPNAFNTAKQTSAGLAQFMEAGNKDASVVNFERIIVQPGDYKTLYLDRAEGAAWIGIVCGYYDLQPERVSALYEIPKIGRAETPGKIAIGLVLGPIGILQAKSQPGFN